MARLGRAECKVYGLSEQYWDKPMLVVVVYDIADDRRRLRLSNFLEGFGRRVQESVFECFIDLDEMQKLYKRVQKQVKSDLDNVRFYWVPSDALPKTLTIGSQLPEPPPEVYII
jgi:CRISPR-associated protein Cas2